MIRGSYSTVMSLRCFEIHSSIVSERAICCVDPREVGGASMRASSRIPLFKMNSAGVTPVEVFSNVFKIRCTMGSCLYDHFS